MTDTAPSFGGSIPAVYDEALGPMFFEPYARDLARRLNVGNNAAVLEIAAGTGILTRHVLAALPRDARLVATDINEAMLAVARAKIDADPRLTWRQADAGALPFADRSFDAVVCQFGVMFFADKAAALRDMRRVLVSGGQLLFNTWCPLVDNPIADIAHRTVAEFFHTDPPMFFTIPFGFHDGALIARLLREAGFTDIRTSVVDRQGESDTAELAARGLVFGNPLINAIEERGTADPDVIMHAVAARLAEAGGAAPLRLPMRALIFQARAVRG